MVVMDCDGKPRRNSFVNINSKYACLLRCGSVVSLASHSFVVRSQLHPVCVFRRIQEKAPVGLRIAKKACIAASADGENINEEVTPSNVIFHPPNPTPSILILMNVTSSISW